MNNTQQVLKVYDPEKTYHQDKSNVIMSHGFIRSGETESVRQIYKSLKGDYNVYIFDNAGHGDNNHVSFNIDQQRKVLQSVLNDPLLDNKTNHLLLSCMPALLSSYVLVEQKELLRKIETLSIYAPVINIKNGIKRNFQQKKIPKILGDFLISSGVFHQYLLKKGVNVSPKHMVSLDSILDSDKNINVLNQLGKELPLHLLCNRGDPINDGLPDRVELDQSISMTYQDIARHHVYFQENIDYTNINGISIEDTAMGDMVREFIKKFENK